MFMAAGVEPGAGKRAGERGGRARGRAGAERGAGESRAPEPAGYSPNRARF
jgi:hypothetical protein